MVQCPSGVYLFILKVKPAYIYFGEVRQTHISNKFEETRDCIALVHTHNTNLTVRGTLRGCNIIRNNVLARTRCYSFVHIYLLTFSVKTHVTVEF